MTAVGGLAGQTEGRQGVQSTWGNEDEPGPSAGPKASFHPSSTEGSCGVEPFLSLWYYRAQRGSTVWGGVCPVTEVSLWALRQHRHTLPYSYQPLYS